MRVYRISPPKYVRVALSGEGASRSGGRWNSIGVRIGYTSGSVSLAMLEMLVHVDRESVPSDRRLLTFDVPDDAVDRLQDFPPTWDALPYCPAVQEVGDRWAETGSSLGLVVPSAIARHDSNVLINPTHPRFSEVRLLEDVPLALDARLFSVGST